VCQAALDFPGKVGGIAILAGALSPELEQVYWYQRVADFAFVPWLLPHIVTTSNREMLPLKRELESLSARLPDIACPVVIMHGQKDMLVPFANVAYMQQKIPADRIKDLIVLPDENHFLPWTAESTIRSAIAGFS
jgi:pimeloyl-ACP methyl ester carboxylesterase